MLAIITWHMLNMLAGITVQLHASLLPVPVPFNVGERLTYQAHAGPGLNGTAVMWVDGPVDVRGTQAIALHSLFQAKVGFLKVSDRSTSWVNLQSFSAMRFQKEERHVVSRHDEVVEIDGISRRWSSSDGRSGETLTDAPLDELSFIYALRGMSLDENVSVSVTRHFDADRNPTVLRFTGRGSVETPMGRFATREIEMRVRDSKNYKGEGVLRISLSDDACRRPVRIVSAMPGAGTVTMTLASAEPVIAGCMPAGGAR